MRIAGIIKLGATTAPAPGGMKEGRRARASGARRRGAALASLTMAATLGLVLTGPPASAAIVATVPLATAANYAVLGGETVTNTGDTTLDGSLGLSPGTSITGFPPGLVLPPGTTDTANAAAQQAQTDLTAAYVDAAGRPIDATTTADLANLTLQPGVYSGPSKGPLSLSGPLVLDAAGDPSAVFIFQTDSTLITGSGSTVTLINGAQECNVFWQVGSSATLGTGSVFVGTILAQTSITVTTGVTVHGRALARTGAVTLDTDTFTKPTCAPTTPLTVSYPAGEGIVGAAFSLTPTVQGASGAVSYRVTAGTLPAGLTLDTATGIIAGTPTEAGTQTVTVEATDTAGTVQAQVTIRIAATLPATGLNRAGTQAVIGALVLLAGITVLTTSRRPRITT